MTARNHHFFDGLGPDVPSGQTEFEIAIGACKMPSLGVYPSAMASTLTPEDAEALALEVERAERKREKVV
jgi:hypothetical protein